MSPIPQPIRRVFCSVLVLTLALLAAPAGARAEDGYALWLRYAPIESAPLRDACRQAFAGLVVQQSPATAAIVSSEVTRALKGLAGVDVPAWTSVQADGAVVIGTASSPIVAGLGWGEVLKGLGPEGYVIRATRIAGKRAIVVASEGDRGALYGTFHLLRLLSTGTPVTRLDVREKPRHQLRMVVPNDPWGRPYVYTDLSQKGSKGKARKDHKLNPINADFDLYSVGEDGKSATPLPAAASQDDVIRAREGAFLGLASEF